MLLSLMTRTVLVLVACASLSALPAYADDIVIGFADSKSGWMNAYSGPSAAAAKMKIKEINAAGGLLGRQIRIVDADAKTDQVQGTKAGQAVLSEGADMVVVDCDFDIGAPAALKAQAAHKIAFFLCAGDAKAGVDGVGKYAFSGGNAAQLDGVAVANWGYKAKGYRTAYALTDDTINYSKSVCAGFKYAWHQLEDAKLLGEDSFQNSDPSIAVQINRLKALPVKPDVIALCSFVPGGAAAIRQLRAAGITAPVVSGVAMDGTYWLAAAPDLSNFYVSAFGSIYGDAPEPQLAEFIKNYTAATGKPPETAYPLTGYAMIELWSKAVERAGSVDTDKVLAELNKMHDEPTILGPRGFSPELHIQSKARYAIIGIDHGQAKFQEYFTAGPVPKPVLMKN